jgi:hypothetical protein
LIETFLSLSGVSLVRFFPLMERNEHRINSPINCNLSPKHSVRLNRVFLLPLVPQAVDFFASA